MKKIIAFAFFLLFVAISAVQAKELGREYMRVECRDGLVYTVKYRCSRQSTSGLECTNWDVIDMKQIYAPGRASLVDQDPPQPKVCK
jgi:hypothetical protein